MIMNANDNEPKKIAFLRELFFLRKGNSFPLAYSRGNRIAVTSQSRGVCTALGPGVAAEEQKQDQDTDLEILHWNMMALYSLQLSNFERNVRPSLSY